MRQWTYSLNLNNHFRVKLLILVSIVIIVNDLINAFHSYLHLNSESHFFTLDQSRSSTSSTTSEGEDHNALDKKIQSLITQV